MTQNTSSAVMAQRKEPDDSLDFFPTPAWATRALCEHVLGHLDLKKLRAWDPCCGELHMVKPLEEYFNSVGASDIFDYGVGARQTDFLLEKEHKADWLNFNPPFKLGDQFVQHALDLAKEGVAVFCRTQFLEGTVRHKKIFSKHRPATVAIFTERVPLFKGRVAKWVWKWDKKACVYVKTKASTATSYCWVVWNKEAPAFETEFIWIPPCRKRLERDSDYPPLGPPPELPPLKYRKAVEPPKQLEFA